MKKRIALSILSFFMLVGLFAHTPFIMVDDNSDGTVFIECFFSNNASAAGLTILFVDDAPYSGSEKTWEGKKILYIGTLNKAGCLETVKPVAEKYTIVFDAGPGHVTSAKGPVLTEAEKADWEKNLAKHAKRLGKWEKKLRGLE